MAGGADPRELTAFVTEALNTRGWTPEQIDALTTQEEQKQAQASATGGYYWGSLSDKQPDHPAPGDVHGWRQWLSQFVPERLKGDPEFMNTLLAGAHGESSLDATRVQQNGLGRGLFQFDMGPGAMGAGIPEEQLFDPAFQASRIVPVYADVYQSAPTGLSPAERASWVAAHAEYPEDYQNPNSAARRNYVRSYQTITAPSPTAFPPPPLGLADQAAAASQPPASLP